MPFKHNACRRHHIGKMKLKVTNWSEYEAGLRRRGSLTLWMTPEALVLAGAQAHDTWPAALFRSGDRDRSDAGTGVRPEAAPDGRLRGFGVAADGAGSSGSRSLDAEPSGR